MVIENQCSGVIYVGGSNRPIEPGARRYTSEHIFDTIEIHSDAGKIEIVVEYCIRIIHNTTSLYAVESDECDDTGRKIIVVKDYWEEYA